MANFVRAYINYILHDLPDHPTPNGFDVVEEFPRKLFQWTAMFMSIFLVMKYIFPKLYPEWYAKLSDRKKREFPSYVICTIHHVCMVPRGWYDLYVDFNRTDEELKTTHYAMIEAELIPFIYGYFIADLILFAIPESMITGGVEFLLHHLMTVYLLYAVMIGSGHLLRYGPHFIISETANIFFSIAWLMRTSDSFKNWSIVKVFEMLFAICFFFHRVVNLTFALFAGYNAPQADTMGYGKYTFFPIVFLQWFWFYKIVQSLMKRGGGGDKKKKGTAVSGVAESKGDNDIHTRKENKKSD